MRKRDFLDRVLAACVILQGLDALSRIVSAIISLF